MSTMNKVNPVGATSIRVEKMALRESRIPDGKHPFGDFLCVDVSKGCAIFSSGERHSRYNYRFVKKKVPDGESKLSLISANLLGIGS